MTLGGWEIILVKLVVLPVLRTIADILMKQAEETPDEWDNVAVGTFKSIIAYLENPGFALKVFKEK